MGCLGVGRNLIIEEPFKALPFDRAWEIALLSAEQMCEEGKKINPYNFPVLVKIGTSKTRNIITLRYGKVLAKQFVPHFAAKYYVHIKLIKQDDRATGVQIEVTQMKGVKKKELDQEAENVKNYCLCFLRKNWN